MSQVEVRGYRAYSLSSHPLARALALVIDAAAGMIALLVILRRTGATPVPSLWWPIAGCSLGAALWIGARLFFGVTPGEQAWQLRAARADADAGVAGKLRWLVQQGALADAGAGALLRSSGMALTLASLAAIPLVWYGLFATHPLWLRAELRREAPVDPASLFPANAGASVEASARSNAATDAPWVVSPFYYALGAWPAEFEGNPIFFSIPYEKGPPNRFIGHMVARWDAPEVRLTLEGPRTPAALAGGGLARADLEVCLASSFTGSLSCMRARQATLGRHLSEISAAVDPRTWRLQWLVVDNPALPAAERVQGLYLSGRGDTRGQDRFILVLPNGAEQAMILDYPTTARGDKARELFMTSIRTFQVSPDLAQGIRWADHEIENVRLDDLMSITSPRELVARLARVQSVLLGKLSVDPRTYDTYFHLAGTASLLASQASKEKREDWLSVARPMIQNLYLYAKDIAPGDPRTTQLEKLWLQVKSR